MPGVRAEYPDRRHTLFSLRELAVTRESDHLTTLGSGSNWIILSKACCANHAALSTSNVQNQSCPGRRKPATAAVDRWYVHRDPYHPGTRLAGEYVGVPGSTRFHMSRRHGHRPSESGPKPRGTLSAGHWAWSQCFSHPYCPCHIHPSVRS